MHEPNQIIRTTPLAHQLRVLHVLSGIDTLPIHQIKPMHLLEDGQIIRDTYEVEQFQFAHGALASA